MFSFSSDKIKPTTVRSLISAVKQAQTDNVNKLIARPAANESIQTKEMEKQKILSTVKKLLEASSGEDHIQKIASVLGYLGEIVIDPSTFISKKNSIPLNEYMNLKSNEQSAEEKLSQTFPFSRDEANQFVDLYKKIANYYNQIKSANCKWFFSYPLSDDGQIQRSGIQEWQRIMVEEKTKDMYKAFRDFSRDFLINGKSLTNQSSDVIRNAIVAFVDQNKDYDPKTNEGYDADSKNSLKLWLLSSGGQDVNRFVDLLSSMNNDLSTDPKVKYLLGKVDPIKSNWFNASNGQIQFEYTMNIKTMLVVSDMGIQSLMRDGDGVVRLEEQPPEGPRVNTLLPLMTVDARVELNVINDVVKPKLLQLDLLSFAGDYLTSPAKKLEGPSEEQKTSFSPNK